MKKQYLYLIVVLAILVTAALAWSVMTPVGAFTSNFDFSLSASPGSGTIIQGQSATSTITAKLLKSKTQLVRLSLSGCPAATTCGLSRTSGYPTFTSALTVTTTASTPLGSHTITIKGVGGSKTKTTTFTLAVNPIPCTCGSWTNGACGAGGCIADQRQQTRTCTPAGCDITSQCVVDSSCVTNPDSCTDNDGGTNYNITGIVSGYINNTQYSYTDYCGGAILREYYCSGTMPLSSMYPCNITARQCINGACV